MTGSKKYKATYSSELPKPSRIHCNYQATFQQHQETAKPILKVKKLQRIMAPSVAHDDVQVQAISPTPTKTRTIPEIKKGVQGLTQSASFRSPLTYSGTFRPLRIIQRYFRHWQGVSQSATHGNLERRCEDSGSCYHRYELNIACHLPG